MELDSILDRLCMDRDTLARCIQEAGNETQVSENVPVKKCHACDDNYTALGTGLVRPRKISFDECKATQHKFHCQCTEYLQAHGVTQAQTIPVSGDTDEADIEEEYYKKSDVDVDELCKEYALTDLLLTIKTQETRSAKLQRCCIVRKGEDGSDHMSVWIYFVQPAFWKRGVH